MKKIVRPLEIKSLDEKGLFNGYGSVFGNTDSYRDVVVKGAFKNDLSTKTASKVKLLWQHDSRMPIGVYHSITEKEYGLEVQGQLLVDEVQQAREAYALLKAGAIDGLSIGYTVNDSNIGQDGKNYLTDLKLWEISIVTFPANELAIINDVKSSIETIREFETFLRDVGGFSASNAKLIAARGYKAICDQREVDSDADLLEALKELSNKFK
jgi:HK97 family phage prohead protease